jgi:hypothetical protein
MINARIRKKLGSSAIGFAFQGFWVQNFFEQSEKNASGSHGDLQVSGIQQVLIHPYSPRTTLDQKCSKKIAIRYRQACSKSAKRYFALH